MKKTILITFFYFILFLTANLAQSSFSSILGTSHFARTIRLGNAYTGVAEGTEALFYNVAGIADSKAYGVLFSKGQGYGIFVEDVKAYDYAIVAPLPDNWGNIGLSINTLAFQFYDGNFKDNIYSLGYAKNIIDDLSIGLTANYYYFNSSSTNISAEEPYSVSGTAFDINLGILYELPELLKITDKDKFKIGFQIKNLLNSKTDYNNSFDDEPLYQNLRLGTSYKFSPNMDNIYGLHPLKLLLTFDVVFFGSDYDFRIWQPNYGIELTIFELLEVSFGRESEKKIKEVDYQSPQHPVNRYGFGLNIPLDYLLELSYKVNLKIDYCISDWQQIDENNVQSEIFDIKEIDDKAFSIGLTFGF